MLNVSARKHRLLIGGQNWSDSLLETTSWQSTPIDSSGLVRTTATLILMDVPGLPGSLDDRKNPQTWRTGQLVTIDVTNSSGVLTRHPAGCLRILSAEYSYEDRRLTLNCGCLITLLSYRQPTSTEEVEITPGGFVSRKTLVVKLLNLGGINNINCPFEIGFRINYPLNIGSSYIQTAGALLYSAGMVGWVDNQEVFQIKPVSLTGNPAQTLQIGNDTGQELWYRRLSNAQSPREIIKVRGTKRLARKPEYPKITQTEKYGPASAIDSSLGSYTVVLERERIEENYGGKTLTISRRLEQPVGLIDPDDLFKVRLIISEIAVTTQSYESSKEGKLTRTFTRVFRSPGLYLAEYIKAYEEAGNTFIGKTRPTLCEEILTTHRYDSKNQPQQITTTKQEAEGALLAGTNFDWDSLNLPPTGLRRSEVTIESWEEGQTPQEWTYSISTSKSISRVKPEAIADDASASQRISLISESSTRTKSNSGQTVPPAPETNPPDAGFEDKQVEGEARFSQYGGNPYQERERTFEVDYLAGGLINSQFAIRNSQLGDAQCELIAQIEGALLYGRFKGQDLGTELHDALFNWQPLMRVNCIEPDGMVRAFCLDDAHWFLGEERCIANFSMVWIGDETGVATSVPVTTNAIASPGNTTIVIQPSPGYIPANTTLNLNGVKVVTVVPVPPGEAAIAVGNIPVIIPSGASDTYTDQVLKLPYVRVQSLVAQGIGVAEITARPYALTTTSISLNATGVGAIAIETSTSPATGAGFYWDNVTEEQWNSLSESSWNNCLNGSAITTWNAMTEENWSSMTESNWNSLA